MRPVNCLPAATVSLACIFLASCGSSNTPPPVVQPDIYIAGFYGNAAAYWKNGTEVDLSDGTNPSVAVGIAVNGSNIVAAGYSNIPQGNNGDYTEQAYVWNNGTQTALNDNGIQTIATSVAVSGSDIYVSGYSYDIPTTQQYAVLWKNGTPTRLTGNNGGAIAQQVIISGADVYVVGQKEITTQTSPNSYNTETAALYWKNGTEVDLTNGQYLAQTRGIAVSGSDVYVVGAQCLSLADDCELPYYWKNGTAVQLSNNYTSIATSISIANNNVWITSQLPDGTPIVYENGQQQNFAAAAVPTSPNASNSYGDNFYTTGTGINPTNRAAAIAVSWMGLQQNFSAPTSDPHNSSTFAIAVVAPPE